MKWIKDMHPPFGKEVLIVQRFKEHYYYSLGYYCCKSGWNIDSKSADPVYAWSELPELEKE